jgi:hypothetical protein
VLWNAENCTDTHSLLVSNAQVAMYLEVDNLNPRKTMTVLHDMIEPFHAKGCTSIL